MLLKVYDTFIFANCMLKFMVLSFWHQSHKASFKIRFYISVYL